MLNHELSIPCGMLLCGWLLWTHWRQTPRIHRLMAPLSVSLVLGVVGASPGGQIVRLVGVAGLVAGAFSMGAGEYLSMAAQREKLLPERMARVRPHGPLTGSTSSTEELFAKRREPALFIESIWRQVRLRHCPARKACSRRAGRPMAGGLRQCI